MSLSGEKRLVVKDGVLLKMMFYTHLFTSKRAPLSKIWLAAHWERKLTKAHVFECNLETTIEDIISPKIKIGLRPSGHLLFGVVRIFSRKAKYLLADCNNALDKIELKFRPGQTDMPVEGLETNMKAITLVEDVSTFDDLRPHLSDTDVMDIDPFLLNQSRSEDITVKEDLGESFMTLANFDESRSHQNVLLDGSFQSLAHHDDSFGDEGEGVDLLGAARTVQVEMATPASDDTTLPVAEALALRHKLTLSNSAARLSESKRLKRKRHLVVDQTKVLTTEVIQGQLADWSDVAVPLDVAPSTWQLMQWEESGAAEQLLTQPCSTVIASEIKELFAQTVFQVSHVWSGDIEVMQQDAQGEPIDTSVLSTDMLVMDTSADGDTELTVDHLSDSPAQSDSALTHDGNSSDITHLQLPSEDAMLVHPSHKPTTHAQLDIQYFEEKRVTRRAQMLLDCLKSSHDTATFSLQALCAGRTNSQAATTFFSLLVLSKQRVLHLHQSGPFKEIFATRGPSFYQL